MNLVCSLCNEIADEPVVSSVSGNVYERRLILKYLEDNGNQDPINGRKLTKQQLVNLNTNVSKDKIKRQSGYTIPALVKFLQERWDEMKIEIFQLKKQLALSNREVERLINQQKDSSNIISILTKELNRYKKMEESKLNDNLYININPIDSNIENINGSLHSSSNCSSLKNEFLDHNRLNNLKNNFANTNNLIANNYPSANLTNHSINSRFSDQSGSYFTSNQLSPKLTNLTNLKESPSSIQKYGRQMSMSSEYVNLDSKLNGRNYRTQSVIIQNDSPFESELNKMRSCEESLNNCRMDYKIQKKLDFDDKFLRPNSQLGQMTSSSSGSFKSSLNKLLMSMDQKNSLPSVNSLTGSFNNVCMPDKKKIPDENLYCNLKDLKEIEHLNKTGNKKFLSSTLANYQNILMYEEDLRGSQHSINKLENLNRLNLEKFEPVKNGCVKGSHRVESWAKDFNTLLKDDYGKNAFTVSFIIFF